MFSDILKPEDSSSKIFETQVERDHTVRDKDKAVYEANTVVIEINEDKIKRIPEQIGISIAPLLKSWPEIEFNHTISCGYNLGESEKKSVCEILKYLGYEDKRDTGFFIKKYTFRASELQHQ